MGAFNRILVTFVLANSMLACVTYALTQGPLQRCLANFEEAHSKLDEKAQLAEQFCEKVGHDRFYRNVLRLGGLAEPDLALLRKEIFTIEKLSRTGDADAAISIIMEKNRWSSDREGIVDEIKSEVDSLLVPACRSLVDALRGVYYGKYIVDNLASLEEEIRDTRGRDTERRHSVDRFIQGWAHVHFCQVLLSEGGTEGLKRKIPGRFGDLKLMERRRLRKQRESNQANTGGA